MTMATLGAIAIGEMAEAVAVMFFYVIGEFSQDLSVNRSRRSVKSLLELKPDFAGLLVDGVIKKVPPEDVKPGDRTAAVKGGKVAFVGDGINDAPVLARADVGIAMGAFGSDAAIETADAVLMTDSPSAVATVIRIANKTRTIVWQNIIFALGVKMFFIIMGVTGIANYVGSCFWRYGRSADCCF